MIQRKQTLFIILVLALMIPLYFCNLATFEFFKVQTDNLFTISAVKATSGQAVYPLTILLSLIVALSVAIIALFKKNLIQLRLVIMLIVLIFGFIGIEAYTLYKFYGSMEQFTSLIPSFNSKLGIAAFLPLPALFFAYLAFKGIARDLFILRSYNKMR